MRNEYPRVGHPGWPGSLQPDRTIKTRPERPSVESPYLNYTQAAEYTGLSVQTLKNNRRRIKRMPGTGRWLTTREHLDAFLASRRGGRR